MLFHRCLLTVFKPLLHVAIERRSIVVLDDFTVLGITLVLLALLKQLAGFAKCFLRRILWRVRSSAKVAMTSSSCASELKIITEGEELIDP